jgi:peptidoglycan/LPS O-acetylase OafA/YrhL
MGTDADLPTATNEVGAVNQRLRSVDACRGLAALAVLAVHIPHFSLEPGHLNGWLFFPVHYGFKGVIFFLVISGFCIHLRVAQRSARAWSCDWVAFWRRRFFRLYPPYLAAILFSLLIILGCNWRMIASQRYTVARVSFLGDLVTHLLLVHNLFPKYSLGMCNGAFWTLGLEEQLYLLYAAYLLLRCRLSAASAFLATLAMSFTWCLVAGILPFLQNRPDSIGWFSWPFGVWSIWVLGAVSAEAYARVITLPRWCYSKGAILVFGGLGILCYDPLLGILHVTQLVSSWSGPNGVTTRLVGYFWFTNRTGDFAFAVAFFVVINRWIRAETAGRPGGPIMHWLARVGTMSYSLYLTHWPVIAAAKISLQSLPFGKNLIPVSLRYLVEVPLALAVAKVFFQIVERRFLHNSRPRRVVRPLAGALQQAA